MRSRRSKLAPVLAPLLLGLGIAPALAETELVACGMSVKGTVVLTADLDCSLQPLPSVTFTDSGQLHLNGFTLTGEVYAEADVLSVFGPGTITGPGYGIRNLGGLVSARVHVYGASIVGNAEMGILAWGELWRAPAAAKITDSVVSGNGQYGVVVSSIQRLPYVVPLEPIKLLRSNVNGNGLCGLVGAQVDVKESSVSNNGTCGISIGDHTMKRLRVRDSVLDGNSEGAIECINRWGDGRFRISDTTMIGNRIGVLYNADDFYDGNQLTLKNVTIQDGDFGLDVALDQVRILSGEISNHRVAGIRYLQMSGRPVALRDTAVTGNGTDPDCGVGLVCADIDSDLAPSLDTDSSCGTSHDAGSGLPGSSWGVCSAD